MLKIKSNEKVPKNILVPLPSYGLNYVLGGGIRTGNIHIFWGPPGCGKTTTSLHVLAQLQKQGYHVIVIDTEHSITEQWLDHCGVDLEREVWRGNIVEDILKDLLPALQSGKKIAVLFDSINGIEWQSFYDNVESSSGQAGGARARRLLWLKILQYMHPENTIFLAVAQQTNDLKNTMSKMPVAKLGEAEKHWGCNIIKLYSSAATANVTKEKDTERITSKKVTWKIEKSKQAPIEGTIGYYWIDLITSKIDRRSEIINLAVKNKVIEQKGAWFYFDDKKFHGLEALSETIDQDMEDRITEVLMKTELVFDVEAVEEDDE